LNTSNGPEASGTPGYNSQGYREIPDAINVSPHNPLWEFMKYVLGSVLLILGVFWLATTGFDRVVPYLPKQADTWLAIVGDIYLQQFKNKKELGSPDQYTPMLQEFRPFLTDGTGQQASNKHIEVYQGTGPTFNAVTLPGGKIVLYDALMSTMPSDDARRFVFAHELGHLMLRHDLSIAGKIVIFTSLAFPVTVLMPQAGTQYIEPMMIFAMQHSQQKELEADRYAIALMQRSGHDPRAGIQVFEQLEKMTRDDNVPAFTKTHPPNPERMQQVIALTSKTAANKP
jgi:predicted Zn-dependent protease